LTVIHLNKTMGAVVQLIEYRTRNQEFTGSTDTRSYCVLRPTQPPTLSGTGNE